MQILLLIIQSKNKKSLDNFFNFLTFYVEKKLKIKKTKKQKIVKTTLLKSPHVHKSAQEHFEYRLHKRQILIFLFEMGQFVVFIKKIVNFSFYDVKIVVNHFLHIKHKKTLKFFCLTNFCLSLSKKHNYYYHKKKIKTYSFLKLLNITGTLLK